MTRFRRAAIPVVAAVLLMLIATAAVVSPPSARADLTDDLLNGTAGDTGATKADQAAADKAAADQKTKNDSAATAATGTTTGGGGPSVPPAVSPVVVDSYATDPILLQAGTRFKLSLTLKNPGGDTADDVLVRIGPSSTNGWGQGNPFVVMGNGSAQYIGSLDAGASNSNATFDILANPNAPGGAYSVPVTITWKGKTFEHTNTETLGLLVNSYVSFDTSISAAGTQYQKKPFLVKFSVKNNTSRTVKALVMRFSGSGATASNATSISVGDLAPNATKVLSMKYTAPLIGRAKIIGSITYVDDFGSMRSVDTSGWARVQRAPDVSPDDAEDHNDTLDQVASFVSALFGVNG